MTSDGFQYSPSSDIIPLSRPIAVDDHVQILIDADRGLIVFQVNNIDNTLSASSHCFRYAKDKLNLNSTLSISMSVRDGSKGNTTVRKNERKKGGSKGVDDNGDSFNVPIVERVFDMPISLAKKDVPILSNLER